MHVRSRIVLCLSLLFILLFITSPVLAKKYDLTRNSVNNPDDIDSTQVYLYGIRLGDSEIDAVEELVNRKIPGVRIEQEGAHILLWDQSKPTGPMAGVSIAEGKVEEIFINNRFAHKTRGIFRRVLTSQSAKEIRELLGKEDYGDENVMGAMLHYEKRGFLVNYLGRDVNVVFSRP